MRRGSPADEARRVARSRGGARRATPESGRGSPDHPESLLRGLRYCAVRMDRSQLLRGVLDAAVLAVVQRQDGYGYDVVRRLRATGLADVGDASVYGTLRRLYRGGALTSYVVPSDEGPHRRYYGITDSGRTQLSEAHATWTEFVRALGALLDETDAEVTA